jgi:hypothetical protein
VSELVSYCSDPAFRLSVAKGKKRQSITRVDSSDSDELSLVKERRLSKGTSSAVVFLQSSASESSMDDLVMIESKSRASSVKVDSGRKKAKSRIVSSSDDDDDLLNFDFAKQFTSKRNSAPSTVRKSTVVFDLTTSPLPHAKKENSCVKFVLDSDESDLDQVNEKTAPATVIEVCFGWY